MVSDDPGLLSFLALGLIEVLVSREAEEPGSTKEASRGVPAAGDPAGGGREGSATRAAANVRIGDQLVEDLLAALNGQTVTVPGTAAAEQIHSASPDALLLPDRDQHLVLYTAPQGSSDAQALTLLSSLSAGPTDATRP